MTCLDTSMESSTGFLLRSGIELDTYLRYGIPPPFEQIDAREFRVLKLIREERDRHQADNAREAQEQQQQLQKQQRSHGR
jgi:hypothetical protein